MSSLVGVVFVGFVFGTGLSASLCFCLCTTDALAPPTTSQVDLENANASRNTEETNLDLEPNQDEYRFPKTEDFWRSTKYEAQKLWSVVNRPDVRMMKQFDEIYTKDGLLRPMIFDENGTRTPFRSSNEPRLGKQAWFEQADKLLNFAKIRRVQKQFVKMRKAIRILFRILQAHGDQLSQGRRPSSEIHQIDELFEIAEQESELQAEIELLDEQFQKAMAEMLKDEALSVLANSIVARKVGMEKFLKKFGDDLVASMIEEEQKALMRVFSEFCFSESPITKPGIDEQIEKFFDYVVDLRNLPN